MTDNTMLYEFVFRDRDNERKKLDAFLSDSKGKILWIYGHEGYGKTFFLLQCLENNSHDDVIYVKCPESKDRAIIGECLYDLLEKLKAKTNEGFVSFLNQYKELINAFKEDFNEKIPLIQTNLWKYIISKNAYFIDRDSQQNNLPSILNAYIEKHWNNKALIIAIDNLENCDLESLNILIDFIKYNLADTKKRFILISTNLNQNPSDNEKELARQLPHHVLQINEIPDQDCFISMLPVKLSIENLTKNDIEAIYNFCHGIPEKLQDLLFHLDMQNKIDYMEDKIKLKSDQIEDYIKENRDSDKQQLEESIFNNAENQSILLVIVCIGKPLSGGLLKMCAEYLYYNTLCLPFTDEKYREALQSLMPRPIKLDFKNNTYYTDQSSVFDQLKKHFNENGLYQYSCNKLYDFFQKHPDDLKKYISVEERNELLADLAYDSENFGWENINYLCGKSFFDTKNMYHAFKYFQRLKGSDICLHAEQQYTIGVTYYEIGKYKDAVKILEKVCTSELSASVLYYYYIYYGKSLNMIRDHSKAEDSFKKASDQSLPDSNNKIYAEYLRHLVLIQLPDKWKEGEEIYTRLVEKVISAYQKGDNKYLFQIANAKLLKCCYNFYYNQDALNLMNIGEKIAVHLKDPIEQAFILHNIGFEYIREDKTDMALKYFDNAYTTLCKLKIHESAYPLNNRGICKMFSSDYPGAADDLTKALLYAESYYVKLTSTTMLMQCYHLLKKQEEYNYYKKKLEKEFEKEQYDDPAIVRKIYMNLAICEHRDGNDFCARKCMKKIEKIIPNTSSEYRADKLCQELFSIEEQPEKKYIFSRSEYFNNLNFEPWFITLSHD